MRMNANMITRTTSEVRRFCSDDGKGFTKKGCCADGPDMAGGVVTVTPILVEGYPPRFGFAPEIDPSTR
jgi:uncharacterized protein (DUF2237 family)